jgi:hypothetical protein
MDTKEELEARIKKTASAEGTIRGGRTLSRVEQKLKEVKERNQMTAQDTNDEEEEDDEDINDF